MKITLFWSALALLLGACPLAAAGQKAGLDRSPARTVPANEHGLPAAKPPTSANAD